MSEQTSSPPVEPGSIVAGVLAFIATFLAVPVVAGQRPQRHLNQHLHSWFPMTDVSDPLTSLLLTANAHFVPFSPGTLSVNALFSADAVYVALVPVLALLGAGAVVANADDPAESVRRGSAIALGYVPVAIVAQFAFGTTSQAGSHSIAPDLIPFVAATAVHAIVFGGLGGLIGYATRTDRDTSLRQAVRSVPLRAGAVAGAIAYAVGYAASYVLGNHVLAVRGTDSSLASSMSESLPWVQNAPEAVGFLFYNAQFVGLSPATQTERSANFVHSQFVAPAVPNVELLHVAPLVAMLAAGFVVARRTNRGVAAGASIAVGYGVLAIAGLFVFATVAPSGNTVRPEPAITMLRAGFAYPILLGGVGGALGAWTDDL